VAERAFLRASYAALHLKLRCDAQNCHVNGVPQGTAERGGVSVILSDDQSLE
jgi:hypothetical protein